VFERYIEEFVKWRDVDVKAGEVWYESECGNWSVVQGTIEFSDYICTSFVARDNDDRTCISRTHFSVKSFLNCGVLKKYKVA